MGSTFLFVSKGEYQLPTKYTKLESLLQQEVMVVFNNAG